MTRLSGQYVDRSSGDEPRGPILGCDAIDLVTGPRGRSWIRAKLSNAAATPRPQPTVTIEVETKISGECD
jgi:hypothetical protein